MLFIFLLGWYNIMIKSILWKEGFILVYVFRVIEFIRWEGELINRESIVDSVEYIFN